MRDPAVDEFVKSHVAPELQPVAELVRDLMQECAPEAQEVIAYGLPCYKSRKIFALFSPSKKEITFSFTRGIQFEDRFHLLKGNGVSTRHVKLRSVENANLEALRDYIRQAVAHDTE